MAHTAVVVVNWNDAARTARCLRSLAAGDPVPHVYVVDNASPEDPVQLLKAELPSVRLIRLAVNRGYAAGCNAGATIALEEGADQLLFLNNDTEVEPSTVRALEQAAARHPDAILGPTIVFAANPGRVWSAGGAVRRPWMVNWHLGEGEPVHRHRESHRIDWTTGCAMFVTARTYRRLGPFDESLFIYLEDLDWCLRASRLGIETRLVADAILRHEVSATTSRLPAPAVLYYGCRNTYRIAFRHASAPRRLAMLPALAVTVAKLALRNAFWPARRSDAHYRARTFAIVDFIRGRTGRWQAALQ
jgi:GT2 family glycosyltransferase